MEALMQTNVLGYKRRQGKVRDIYDIGDNTLVVAATDRISAFDRVMANGIPNKGKVLTLLTQFWLQSPQSPISDFHNHLISIDIRTMPGPFQDQDLTGRAMLCQKAEVFPVECVVRGYLTGSGWKEYQETGEVCGIKLPDNLLECARLSEPIFTPSTKAETGHDENISFEEMCDRIGLQVAELLRSASLKIYRLAHNFALVRGVIIADTKFEFGMVDGEVTLIDEVLTPDSSRFWPAKEYEPGRGQFSYDKQYVRDWLQKLCDSGAWDKDSPGPSLPEDIVSTTQSRYIEIYKRLTGQDFS